MRQKDPELLKAVEHLSKNETVEGVKLLQQQGRISEIQTPQERFQAIAKDYAAKPENTIIVSPDNRSRQEINQAVRSELQTTRRGREREPPVHDAGSALRYDGCGSGVGPPDTRRAM